MEFTKKFERLLALLLGVLWFSVPGFADDGDSAMGFPGSEADLSRPGSVIVFPKFIKGEGDTERCGTGNVFVDGVCMPRTEIELGAVCPTRFTFGTQANMQCPQHQLVRVRFRWVCPPTPKDSYVCKTTGFEVLLTVNGKVIFTADGSRLPDKNQVGRR
jgi:hypothetical protein